MRFKLAWAILLIWTLTARADLSQLAEYWDFEAAAANDQTGLQSEYVLVHHGATTQETTHKGGSYSAGFGASVYFSIADDIFTGTNTFSGASWLRTSGDIPDSDLFWSKWGFSKNMWTLIASGNKWKLVPRAPDNGSNGTSADSTVTWTGATWHLICWGYDSDTGKIWISVDAETPVEVSCPGFAAGPETLETAIAGASAVTGFIDDTAYFTNHINLGDIQNLYTNDMATVFGFSSGIRSNVTWYVWPGGDNTYATNWATAKTNFYPLSDLEIIPGDTIEVSGGTYVRVGNETYEFPYGTNGNIITIKHSREAGHNGVADIQVPLGVQSFNVIDGAISDNVEQRFYHLDNHYRNVASTKGVGTQDPSTLSGIITNCGFYFNGRYMTNAVPITLSGFHNSAPPGYVQATTTYSNHIKWSIVSGSDGDYQTIKFFDPLSASGNVTNGAGTEIELCYFTNITQWAITVPYTGPDLGVIQIHHCAYEHGRNQSTAGLFSGAFGVRIWSCVLNKWPQTAGGENEDLQMLHRWEVFNCEFYAAGQAMIQNFWDSGSNYDHCYFYGNTLLPHPTNWSAMFLYATNYGPTTIQMSTEAQNPSVCRSNIICEDWRWFNNTAYTDPTNGASGVISIRNKSWVLQDCFPDVTNLTMIFPPGNGAFFYNDLTWGSSNLANMPLYNDFPDFNDPPSRACTNGCGEGYFMGIAYTNAGMIVDYSIFSRVAYSSNNTLHTFPFNDFTNFTGFSHNRTNMPTFRSDNTLSPQLEPTAGAEGGIDLSSWATNMPGLLWDQNGVARGSVNSDGSWSIGALEPLPVVPEGLVCYITFDEDWSGTNIILDHSMGGQLPLWQFGIIGTATNCWPTRIVATNGHGYAAAFAPLPGVTLPYYTNDLDGYVVGDYVGGTNTAAITNLTELSVCVWMRYYAASNNEVANDFNSAILDGGYATAGSWVLARHYDVRSSFLIRTNAGMVEGGPEVTFPDDTSTGDTTNYNFYVAVVDIPNHAMTLYFNGTNCNTGVLPGNITNVTVSADQNPQWLGVGAWTHSGTPEMDLDLTSGGDKYPNNAWLRGAIDEIRIYNRAITSNEVAAIYYNTNTFGNNGGSGPSPSPPTIDSFSASPATITTGSSSTLSWSTTGDTSRSINQSVGAVDGFTSTNVSPTTTTTYTLTAENTDGTVTSNVTVTVVGHGVKARVRRHQP